MGDRVHRRALLALSALVPLARCQRDRRIPRPTLVPAPGAHEQGAARDSGARAERDASRADVIILGAGLAGLRAAEVLASERLSVVVLEARERVGGRVHTHRAWGGSVELGASVIRGLGYDPVASRATAMGLDVRPCDDSYRLLTTEGRELSERRRQRWMTQARELARRARERLGPAEDMPLRVAFERALDDPRVSEEERAGLAWAIRATIERPRAASVDALSLASFEDGGERVGNAGRVTAGLSTLVERMASSLRVERSNPARSIAHSAEGVEVRAERGLWRGRAAIVCVPHGVLAGGQIAFEPSLPIGKQEAIERIKSGALARVALRFSSAFWRPREEQIGVAAPWSQRGGDVEWTDLSRWGLGPTLVAVAAADAGRALETRPEREVVDELCRALRGLFGEAVVAPEAVVRSGWSVDPFSLGALSSLGVRGTPRDREVLAAPVGRALFFAGEATSRGHAGTVRGAYESGERAAREVLAVMGLRAAER